MLSTKDVLFFILLAAIITGCSASYSVQEVEQIEQVVVQDHPAEPEVLEETSEIMEDSVLEETDEQSTNKELVVVTPDPVVEEKFEIFDPVLTYSGAYNGPLYATSEQVGSASRDSYFDTLDRNGINFFIGMFGIVGEPAADALISDQGLGEVIAAAQKHPSRIIPFFNPGIGGEDVEEYLGEELIEMYSDTLSASQEIVGSDFIRGFGEVETQEWRVRHNDQKVLQLVDLAESNNLHFMFHPIATKIDDVQKIIEAYPDTVFLIHMYREDLDKSINTLITLLREHDNLYFSIDAAHILYVDGDDIIYAYDDENQESAIREFVSTFDSKEKSILADAIEAYKPLVDAVPDKVMWGTEIGPEYAFDPDVFDRAVKISRFVIAGFDEDHQEAVAYKNALRVFGEGVVPDSNIEVIDTSSWSECSNTQIDGCDESCDIPDADGFLGAEFEACFLNCIIEKQCREVPEMDIG